MLLPSAFPSGSKKQQQYRIWWARLAQRWSRSWLTAFDRAECRSTSSMAHWQGSFEQALDFWHPRLWAVEGRVLQQWWWQACAFRIPWQFCCSFLWRVVDLSSWCQRGHYFFWSNCYVSLLSSYFWRYFVSLISSCRAAHPLRCCYLFPDCKQISTQLRQPCAKLAASRMASANISAVVPIFWVCFSAWAPQPSSKWQRRACLPSSWKASWIRTFLMPSNSKFHVATCMPSLLFGPSLRTWKIPRGLQRRERMKS